MTLPVTITGLATSVGTVGPFKSSAGNFYLFGRDAVTATTLQAYKSTAPDVSWSAVATKPGFTTAILGISGFQVGDVIHLLVMDGTANALVAHKYQTFNMATDAFVTAETVYAAQNIKGTINAGYGASLVVRSTGEVVALFSGLQGKSGKLSYARVYFSRRTAPAVWSTAVEVDAGGTVDYCRPSAVLGLSDAVHFLFTDAVTSGKQRTLTTANVLQTTSTIALGAPPHQPPYALSYLTGGVQKIVAAEEAGNVSADAWHFDSSNTPVVVRTVVSGSAQPPPVRVFNDGTDVYLVYRDASADLQLVKSTDNGVSWGAPSNIFTGTVGNTDSALSVGNLYTRGTSVVIGFVVLDSTTLKYNEAVVRLVSNSGTLTVTEARDVAALTGNFGTTGTLAASETPDVAAFAGFGVVSGTLAVIEAADVAALTGNAGATGILAALETADIAALSGGADVSGALAATEAFDVAVISGPATIFGSIGAFEAPDISRINGVAFIDGALSATEAPDIAVITGNAGTSGVLAATESSDLANLIGSGIINGSLVAIEGSDTAALSGNVDALGILSTTEASDVAAFTGDFKIAIGTLVATETPDSAAFTGVVINNTSGTLAAIETRDNVVILADYQQPPGQPLSDHSDYDYDWYKREPIRRRG